MQDGVLEKFLDVRCAPTVNANVRCKPGTGGVGGSHCLILRHFRCSARGRGLRAVGKRGAPVPRLLAFSVLSLFFFTELITTANISLHIC